MWRGVTIVAALLAAAGPSAAAHADPGGIDAGGIDDIIRNLDLTSFPNSTAPRRGHGRTSFADHGFVHVERTADGAVLTDRDRGWAMRLTIVTADRRWARVCLRDHGLARPGDVRAPSYDATSALLVTKRADGPWPAERIAAGFDGCRNDPPPD